mgnify:CR=1 FL=1
MLLLQEYWSYWRTLTFSEEQQDALGKLYLEHIIGVPQRGMENFLNYQDPHTFITVGLSQHGILPLAGQYQSFWQEALTLAPTLCINGDLSSLVLFGKEGVARLLQVISTSDSVVLSRIKDSARAHE